MKNGLLDMHNILMEQLERINEAETPEEIEKEAAKCKAMSDVAKTIIDNSKTMLEAQKISYEYGNGSTGNTIYQIESASK